MNTSGPAPPAICVASVDRLVSVSVDADTRVTWMFGYCFSNALISTVRASLAPVPDSGLADQTMLPEVADPVAVAEPAAAGEAEPVLEPRPLVDVLLPPLEPHAARARTPTAARAAPTPLRRRKTAPSRL